MDTLTKYKVYGGIAGLVWAIIGLICGFSTQWAEGSMACIPFILPGLLLSELLPGVQGAGAVAMLVFLIGLGNILLGAIVGGIIGSLVVFVRKYRS